MGWMKLMMEEILLSSLTNLLDPIFVAGLRYIFSCNAV